MRRCTVALVALLVLALVSSRPTTQAGPGQPEGSGSGVSWIWASANGKGPVCFRKAFDIPKPFAHPTDQAVLHITADQSFVVWLNGAKVGEGNDWKKAYRFDVNQITRPGKNVLAIEAQGGER